MEKDIRWGASVFYQFNNKALKKLTKLCDYIKQNFLDQK